MTYLLDTHVLLWLLGGGGHVPAGIVDQLADRRNRVLVSSAAALEVSTKVRLGRLPDGVALVAAWDAHLAASGMDELAVRSAHALLAGSLSWSHRDPFDRLMVAQALYENVTLVTVDKVVLAFPGLKTLTW